MTAATVLQNCNIVDTDAGRVMPDRHILIEEDRISRISENTIPNDNGLNIDARGRFVIPGLIDNHVHAAITTMNLRAVPNRPVTMMALEARNILEAMLLRGFTSVRDAGGADWGLAEATRRGLIKGPRLFFSGKVLSQTGGHGDFAHRGAYSQMCSCSIYTGHFSHVADGVSAVRKAAREELRRGATQIKIMSAGGVTSPTDPVWNVQYSHEETAAVVEEAEGWRTYVMAHAYTPESIRRAVNAGVRSIEHGNLIDVETAQLMAEKGAYIVPTLVTFFKMKERGAELKLPKASVAKIDDVVDSGLRSLEICKEAGVPMGWGTDLLGELHPVQNEEFAIRAEVMSGHEILRSCTTINAEILNRTGELGSVTEGAIADLLVIEGNPLDDIRLLAPGGDNMRLIMKDGAIFKNELT